MKIVHVTSALCRQGAGVKAVVEGLSAAQASQGADVRVLGLATEAWRFSDAALWNGASAEAFDVLGPPSYGYSPDLFQRLNLLAPDLVHLHGLWMYPSKAVADWARATGRPFVLSTHGMLSRVALSFSPTKKRIAQILFADRVLRSTSCFFATAEEELTDIHAHVGGWPIAKITNGIHLPPDDFPNTLLARPTGSSRELLHLGRLHPKKAVDRLIDAWSRVERDFPDWNLRIVGLPRRATARR